MNLNVPILVRQVKANDLFCRYNPDKGLFAVVPRELLLLLSTCDAETVKALPAMLDFVLNRSATVLLGNKKQYTSTEILDLLQETNQHTTKFIKSLIDREV